MRYESRTVVKQRTDEERRRRHLYGDSGAKFTSKKLAIGGGIMTCLTTVPEKDNIIFEIQWI